MKLYDFDGMFDVKLAEYMKKNKGKFKEEQWEDVVPELYKKFGNTYLKSVGNTPNGFYAAMSDEELIKALQTHLKQEVPVSEYLCNAIESRHRTDLLLPLLYGSQQEFIYAMPLIGSANEAIPRYMQVLLDPETDEELKSDCVEYVKEKADNVKELALKAYQDGVEREYMLEILSRCVLRDDAVFDVLVKAFRSDDENIPMHASYLSAYGDERALEFLLNKIDDESISFVEYQELKYAIESLGGSYEIERDFSEDPYYELIKANNEQQVDIFDPQKKN